MTKLTPSWLGDAAVHCLFAALAEAHIEARFVGGCVRDALLGEEDVGDLDLATPAPPAQVIAALKAAEIRGLPTGIAHGTVTAVIPPRTFEITTLRRDVETDGRHAVVAFGADWGEDAARRDFTINAIYLAADGELYDPVGGQSDLAERRVRFVGNPATRIAEDVLRLLRYYRFEARFGGGEGDPAARAACRGAVGRLATLSAERVSRELLRLIASPDPVRVLAMMREDGVLAAILPEATRLDRFARGVRPLSGIIRPEPDLLLRLAMLIDLDGTSAGALGERLRLPATDRKRLAALAEPWPIGPTADAKTQRLALYRVGRETFFRVVLLLLAEGTLSAKKAREMVRQADGWKPPRFPLGGDDVTALGIAPGPRVGKVLAAVRRWWEDGDFAADRDACLARLRELVAQS